MTLEANHRKDAEEVLRSVFDDLYKKFKPFDFDSSGIPYSYSFSLNRHVRNNDILYEDEFEGVSACRYHLRQISDALSRDKFDSAEEHFEELIVLSNEFELGIESITDTVSEAFEVLSIETASPIYVAPSFEPEIPQLLRASGNRLIDFISENPKFLYRMDPRAFEELVAELLYKSGFEVQLTAQTRDGGKDIIAFHHVLNIKSKYIFECKRYAMKNKVSIDVVQRIYGVKHSEQANKAVVVTTSDFTRDARKFAAAHQWDLDLKAYGDLLQWIRSTARKDGAT